VDGPTLTAIRTGAGAGLATSLLARADARVLAMLGAGAMAPDQITAVRTVRPIERTLLWSRSHSRAEALAGKVDAEVVDSADEAVAAADIVTTATPSTRPLFDPAAVKPGTHFNAIGAFMPDMAELPPALLHDAWVVVEDRQAAAEEAGDLLQAGRSPDAEMSDLLRGRAGPPPGATTVFKSTGIATIDVAAAIAALHHAANRQPPKLRSSVVLQREVSISLRRPSTEDLWPGQDTN
jgi:ornithine cyclodeaminase/alanine dehydrogenase-like protein (mu-crystallin family)